MKRKYRDWTEADYHYIDHNYGKVYACLIARKLNRTVRAVYDMAVKRKLVKHGRQRIQAKA